MDDITRMAREAGFVSAEYWPDDFKGLASCVERFAEIVRAAERNKLVAWMMAQGYATGHGDTMEQLLEEFEREASFDKAELWLKRINEAVLAERESTNNAYKERNQLVALLSMLFPSGKAKTAIDGWDEAWHGCVYIDFPWGQASWHYHTDDEQMFAHLPTYTRPWDGHTTEAKYAAIAAAIRARGQA